MDVLVMLCTIVICFAAGRVFEAIKQSARF